MNDACEQNNLQFEDEDNLRDEYEDLNNDVSVEQDQEDASKYFIIS